MSTKKTLLALGCAALLGAASFAAEPAKPACCRSKAAAAQKAAGEKLRCSLTGKVVDTCCCVQREGKLHCTLADKDVTTCCCTPAKAQQNQPK